MDSSLTVLYSAAGLPALISTGITFIYFFLKACCYIFDAISHQTERRVAAATSGCGQQEHHTDMGEEGHTQICEQIQGNLSEQYGRGTQQSSGSIFRWFKFTLKPPYSIARGKLRLAIWDTSFWTFWLKFGHKGP